MATNTLWRTPHKLFDPIHAKCQFKVDAAGSSLDHLIEPWYGPGSSLSEDALTVEKWHSPAWCNPPYGRDLQPFLDKFIEQAELGVQIVALLPAYTGEHWFADKVRPFANLLFLRGRVPFDNPCEHCGGTGLCTAVVDGGMSEDGVHHDQECCLSPDRGGKGCDICDGTSISPKPSQPRFGSVLAFYDLNDYRGRVDWIDWNKVKV